MDSEKSLLIAKKNFTTRDVFGIFVALAAGLLSLGMWQSYYDVLVNPDVRNTVIALIWFSLLGSMFFLGTVVWRDHFSQAITPILIFLASFLHVQTWYHVGFVMVAIMLSYLSIRAVHHEMEDRIHFHFSRNVGAGSFLFVLGLAYALSSMYFVTIRNESWEELVPRFNIGEGTAAFFIQAIAYVHPGWKKMADEGVTVDGLLLSLKEESGSGEFTLRNLENEEGIDRAALPVLVGYLKQNVSEGENVSLDSVSQELYLQTGRGQISQLAGRPVSGDEKITDIFSSAIQHKIIMILSGKQAVQHLTPGSIPLILSLLFFLTLIPVGSVVAILWISLSFFFFRIAIFAGWVKLEQVPREQEILAH